MNQLISCRSSSNESPFRRREGFALIITISLMAFLVLLLVTLVTLIRIETHIALNAQKMATARGNAEMALNIAIGQLQKHAGRDDRVTARSDMLVPTTFWTGVWPNREEEGLPQVWLVSGNEGQDPLLFHPAAQSPPPELSYIRLVGKNTSRPNPIYGPNVSQTDWDVFVPRIPITTSNYPGQPPGSRTIGHYGYWVGDQGIKASLGVTDRSFNLPYPEEESAHLRKLASQRFRGEVFFRGFLPDSVSHTKPALERIIRYEQLDLTASADRMELLDYSGNPGLKSKFHEVTHMNHGVLSNPGGARQNKVDISQAGGPAVIRDYLFSFSREDVTIDSDATGFPLVSPPPRIIPDPPAAIDITPSPPPPGPPPVSSGGSGSPSEGGTNNERPDPRPTSQPELFFTVSPVVSEFALRLGVFEENGQLAVRYQVEVDLWNPYTSSLHGETLAIRLGGPDPRDPIQQRVRRYNEISYRQVTSRARRSLPVLSVWESESDNPTPVAIDLSAVFEEPLSFSNSDGWKPGEVLRFSTEGTLPTGVPFAGSRGSSDSNIQVAFTERQQERNPLFEVELIRMDPPEEEDARLVSLGTTHFEPFTLDPYPRHDSEFRIGYRFFYRDENHTQDWLARHDPRHFDLIDDRPQNRPLKEEPGGLPRGPFNMDSVFDDAYATVIDPVEGATVSFGSQPNALLRSTDEPSTVTLFELPRQEPVSLGLLQHLLTGKRGGAYHFGNTMGNHLDTYFLSTIFPGWDGRTPLPNPRITLYRGENENLPDVGSPISADHLLVKGMFNINSTSYEAWASLLGSIWLPELGLRNAFFRFSHTAHHFTGDPEDSEVMDPYQQGWRALDDAARNPFMLHPGDSERDALAINIVHGIVDCGPFYSLHEFVASRVLQDAIEATPSINRGIPRHSPAFLTQADIFTAIAPFISTRSDTFLIRAYGDATNPVTNKVEARAYCEAIVQRVPTAHSRQNLGRKFKVIEFRWLDPSKI